MNKRSQWRADQIRRRRRNEENPVEEFSALSLVMLVVALVMSTVAMIVNILMVRR